MTTPAKDEVLDRVADRFNVAQFASFGPGDEPALRRCRLRGDAAAVADLRSAAEALLARSTAGTVNVRSFTAEHPQGNPFSYGLATVDEVVGRVRELAGRGLLTIVNETIDVDDGGVSGVRLGGIVEFAPGGTPRVVEEPGVASMPSALAERVIATVYGALLPPAAPSTRVEFSIHPTGAGVRHERTIVWEVDDGAATGALAALAGTADRPEPRPAWPNRFSEHLGDKTFGLVLADALGAPVPLTRVVARSTPPFSFGRPTGHDTLWVRTAPRRFAAGRYTTCARWIDPFALMAREDPGGTEIGAVLVQHGVAARSSGAARSAGGALVVEGVDGEGDEFMQGGRPPAELPPPVAGRVGELHRRLVAQLGPVRIEWADDGSQAWLLQLNQVATTTEQPAADGVHEWLDFDPLDGLDALRSLIDRAVERGAGVRVTRPVGLTSHVGDLLGQAGIPTAFAPAGDPARGRGTAAV